MLCNELESGAITQILWDPDLALVYNDFLEPSWGVQLDFVEPSKIVPMSTRMNFAYVQEKTKEHGAIALGVSPPPFPPRVHACRPHSAAKWPVAIGVSPPSRCGAHTNETVWR